MALPKLNDRTPSVGKQSSGLHTHISTVTTAMEDTAQMFRANQAENMDRVKQIFHLDGLEERLGETGEDERRR